MNKYRYWQSDKYSRYVVRQLDGCFEDYKKGIGWVENPERFDIISGDDIYYTEISEEEALDIIKEIG